MNNTYLCDQHSFFTTTYQLHLHMERVFKALSFPSSEEIGPVRLLLPVCERKHVDNTEKQSLVQSPHNENILDKKTQMQLYNMVLQNR